MPGAEAEPPGVAGPKLIRSAAVLEVSDVVRSAAWYRDKLVFASHGFWGEPAWLPRVRRQGS